MVFAKKKMLLIIVVACVLMLAATMFVPAVQQEAKAADSGFVVFINPGHGPSASGTGATVNGVKESVINEQLAQKMYEALSAKGITVYMTNRMTLYPSTPCIIKTAPAGGGQYSFLNELLPAIHSPWVYEASVTKAPDLVITVHHNSYGSYSNGANGYEMYYSSELKPTYGKTADAVQKASDLAYMIDAQFKNGGFYLNPRSQSVKDTESSSTVNSLLAYDAMPSVLIEAGFMTNATDFANIQNGSNQALLAQRVANAVVEYKGKYNYSSDKTPPTATSIATSKSPVTTKTFNMAAYGVKDDDSGVANVKFAVWSEENGQDDMKWFAAKNKSGSTWSATASVSGTGKYFVKAYATDKAGNTAVIGRVSVIVSIDTSGPTATKVGATSNTVTGKQFDAAAYGVTDASGVASVKFAVWTVDGGQDDLRWYNASNRGGGTWTAAVSLGNFGNKTGQYKIKAFATDTLGNSSTLGTGYVTVASNADTTAPTASRISISRSPRTVPTFSMAAYGVSDPSGIASVKFAVWSEKGGQDDLKWYDGKDRGSGTWVAMADVKTQNDDTGKYYVKVFATDKAGNKAYLGKLTITLDHKDSTGPTASKIATSKGPVAGDSFNMAAYGVTDSQSGVESVKFAVWSVANGQDDLVWYTGKNKGNGTWAASANIAKHAGKTGQYKVKVFATDSAGNKSSLGTLSLVVNGSGGGGGTTDVTGPTARKFSTSASPCASAKFSMAVYGVSDPSGVSKVKFAVWSAENGQDDLKLYLGKSDGNGGFTATADVSTQSNKPGIYYVRAIGYDGLGNKAVFGERGINLTFEPKIDIPAGEYPIAGSSNVTAARLQSFYTSKVGAAAYPAYYTSVGVDLSTFCKLYVQECQAEGIKPEVAFAQMCYETDYLRYGGDVSMYQFNFAGLGATGGVPGFDFAAKYGANAYGLRIGIRGHIQHLKCYANYGALANANVDPRWSESLRGVGPTVEKMGQKWAASSSYATALRRLIAQI